jgi:hypothetical protein
MNTSKVTRFEVIDHTFTGPNRAIVRYGVNVELQLQDDGRTLKVFLTDGEPFEHDMTEWNSGQS